MPCIWFLSKTLDENTNQKQKNVLRKMQAKFIPLKLNNKNNVQGFSLIFEWSFKSFLFFFSYFYDINRHSMNEKLSNASARTKNKIKKNCPHSHTTVDFHSQQNVILQQNFYLSFGFYFICILALSFFFLFDWSISR